MVKINTLIKIIDMVGMKRKRDEHIKDQVPPKKQKDILISELQKNEVLLPLIEVNKDQLSAVSELGTFEIEEDKLTHTLCDAMKVHNGVSDNWYRSEQISLLIKQYAPNVNTLMPASALLGLSKQLDHILQQGQYFIPLNINCLSQNFEDGKRNDLQNNHWADLYVVKNSQQTSVTYLDPMGKVINPQLASEIRNKFGTNDIGQPLLNKPIQCVQLDPSGSFIEKGSYDDCGPFLVYCIASVANGKSIRQDVRTLEQSISFGEYLRESFIKLANFNEIYKAGSIVTELKNLSIDKQDELLDAQCTNHPMQRIVNNHVQDKGMLKTEIIDQYLHQESLQDLKLAVLEARTFLKENLNNLGKRFMELKNYDEAISHFNESLIHAKVAGSGSDPNVVNTLNNLASIYKYKKEYVRAIKKVFQALKIISSLPDDSYAKLTEAIKANVFDIATEFADNYFLDSEEILNKLFFCIREGHSFADYKWHYNKALLLNAKGNRAQAIEECKLALIFTPKNLSEQKNNLIANLSILTKEDTKSIKLWFVITNGDVDSLRQLVIEPDCDLNHAAFINTTPLIQAIIRDNEDMVSVLVEAKADVAAPNDASASPLYCSLGYYDQDINMKIVEILLANGAKPNQLMNDGDTPMHMAHYKGIKGEVLQLLIKCGADINIVNNAGKTPLHCLLEQDIIEVGTKLEIISECLKLYNLTIKDLDDRTVIDYAKEYPEVLSLLSNENQKREIINKLFFFNEGWEEITNCALPDKCLVNLFTIMGDISEATAGPYEA